MRVRVSSPRPLLKLTLSLDGALLGAIPAPAAGEYPFAAYLREAQKGFHTLTARAFDDSGNVGGASVEVNLTAELDPPTIFWGAPPSGTTLFHANFPHTLRFSLHRAGELKRIVFRARAATGGESFKIKAFEPVDPLLSILSWSTAPVQGEYDVFASVTDTSGALRESEALRIQVE
jgi:hypothetical protein